MSFQRYAFKNKFFIKLLLKYQLTDWLVKQQLIDS